MDSSLTKCLSDKECDGIKTFLDYYINICKILHYITCLTSVVYTSHTNIYLNGTHFSSIFQTSKIFIVVFWNQLTLYAMSS